MTIGELKLALSRLDDKAQVLVEYADLAVGDNVQVTIVTVDTRDRDVVLVTTAALQ